MATTIPPGMRRWKHFSIPKISDVSLMAKRGVLPLGIRSRIPGISNRTGLLVNWCSIWCQASKFISGHNRMTPLLLGRPWRHSLCSRRPALSSLLMMSSLPSESTLMSPYQLWVLKSSRLWQGFSSYTLAPLIWRSLMMSSAVWWWCMHWVRNTSTLPFPLPFLLISIRTRSYVATFQTEEINHQSHPDLSAFSGSSALFVSASTPLTCQCNPSSPCTFCDKPGHCQCKCYALQHTKTSTNCQSATLAGIPTRPIPPLPFPL